MPNYRCQIALFVLKEMLHSLCSVDMPINYISNSANMRYRRFSCARYMVSEPLAAFQSSAAPNVPILLRGFAAPFFPPLPLPLPRPRAAPRVEPEPREKDAFRLKPWFPPVETQGSGQSNQVKISTA